jgi:hypothetical protein
LPSTERKKILENYQKQLMLEDIADRAENSATQAEIRETFKNTILD